MNQEKSDKIKCDACQKEKLKYEVKYISLKTCCSVQRKPLCQDCYEKFAKKKGGKP